MDLQKVICSNLKVKYIIMGNAGEKGMRQVK